MMAKSPMMRIFTSCARRFLIATGFAPDGLPVGVQMVGPWLEDPTPLKLAELIEREFGCFVPPKMFDD